MSQLRAPYDPELWRKKQQGTDLAALMGTPGATPPPGAAAAGGEALYKMGQAGQSVKPLPASGPEQPQASRAVQPGAALPTWSSSPAPAPSVAGVMAPAPAPAPATQPAVAPGAAAAKPPGAGAGGGSFFGIPMQGEVGAPGVTGAPGVAGAPGTPGAGSMGTPTDIPNPPGRNLPPGFERIPLTGPLMHPGNPGAPGAGAGAGAGAGTQPSPGATQPAPGGSPVAPGAPTIQGLYGQPANLNAHEAEHAGASLAGVMGEPFAGAGAARDGTPDAGNNAAGKAAALGQEAVRPSTTGQRGANLSAEELAALRAKRPGFTPSFDGNLDRQTYDAVVGQGQQEKGQAPIGNTNRSQTPGALLPPPAGITPEAWTAPQAKLGGESMQAVWSRKAEADRASQAEIAGSNYPGRGETLAQIMGLQNEGARLHAENERTAAGTAGIYRDIDLARAVGSGQGSGFSGQGNTNTLSGSRTSAGGVAGYSGGGAGPEYRQNNPLTNERVEELHAQGVSAGVGIPPSGAKIGEVRLDPKWGLHSGPNPGESDDQYRQRLADIETSRIIMGQSGGRYNQAQAYRLAQMQREETAHRREVEGKFGMTPPPGSGGAGHFDPARTDAERALAEERRARTGLMGQETPAQAAARKWHEAKTQQTELQTQLQGEREPRARALLEARLAYQKAQTDNLAGVATYRTGMLNHLQQMDFDAANLRPGELPPDLVNDFKGKNDIFNRLADHADKLMQDRASPDELKNKAAADATAALNDLRNSMETMKNWQARRPAAPGAGGGAPGGSPVAPGAAPGGEEAAPPVASRVPGQTRWRGHVWNYDAAGKLGWIQ